MKLKRCENLHYYDGDIYMTCPHCEAMAPPNVQSGQSGGSDTDIGTGGTETGIPVTETGGAVQSGTGSPNVGLQEGGDVEAPTPTVITEEPGGTSTDIPVDEPPAETGNTPASAATETGDTTEIPEGPAPAGQQEEPHTEAPTVIAPHYGVPPQSAPGSGQINAGGFIGSLDKAKTIVGTNTPTDPDDTTTVILSDEYDLEEGLVFGWLAVINTDQKGKIFAVKDMKSTIGRGDAKHVVDIDIHYDKTVSRGPQAILVYDRLNRKFFLQDADAKTIVYLNRQVVHNYEEIKPYDIIQLGGTQLLFVPLCTEKFSWE